jgi:alkanesulfonate monooxygenase SsuD/methylene tetrahydromethanopterin reductase-like flavin-dependent oxidoreductase (luciferase family)
VTDYGHPITFGLSLYPSLDGLGETRQLAQAADAGGLDYLAIQDHAYNPEFLDVWTLITYLAAETDRISLFPDVATSSFGLRRSSPRPLHHSAS